MGKAEKNGRNQKTGRRPRPHPTRSRDFQKTGENGRPGIENSNPQPDWYPTSTSGDALFGFFLKAFKIDSFLITPPRLTTSFTASQAESSPSLGEVGACRMRRFIAIAAGGQKRYPP